MASSLETIQEGWKQQTVLSLDGGGIKGYSTLLILEALFKEIAGIEKLRNGVEQEPQEQLLPCDYFNYIVGTSTGGLIAIMLGRLKMRIDECKDAYRQLSNDIFSRPRNFHRLMARPKYDSTKLENKLQEVIRRYSPRLRDTDKFSWSAPSLQSKTLITCTKKDEYGCVPHIFRTYQEPETIKHDSEWTAADQTSSSDLKIWQVARATCAAPSYFRPIRLQTDTYIDGGVMANNPTTLALHEIKTLFDSESSTRTKPTLALFNTVVNIGTGIREDLIPRRSTTISSNSSADSALRRTLATLWPGNRGIGKAHSDPLLPWSREFDTKVVEDLSKLSQPSPAEQKMTLPYYRFEIAESPLSVLEWDTADIWYIDSIEKGVRDYLSKEEVANRITEVAERLVNFRRLRAKRQKRMSSNSEELPPPGPKSQTTWQSRSSDTNSDAADSGIGTPPDIPTSRRRPQAPRNVSKSSLHVCSAFVPEETISVLSLVKGPWKPKAMFEPLAAYGISLSQLDASVTVMAAVLVTPHITTGAILPSGSLKPLERSVQVRADSTRATTPSSLNSKPRTSESVSTPDRTPEPQNHFAGRNNRFATPVQSYAGSGSNSGKYKKGIVEWLEDHLPISISKDEKRLWVLTYCIQAQQPKKLHCKRRCDLPDGVENQRIKIIQVPRRGPVYITMPEEDDLFSTPIARVQLHGLPAAAKFQKRFRRTRLEMFLFMEDIFRNCQKL
ncbi:FabD/lysophospholipase-like protein [Rhizodiscina lignyota]|uniref:FabD/lysophospholipase-like protein n=1 Tax=Rhizodiscina lignyota TaxID=1504668 RepID=A0A9P4M203_9PEZI|nr:FabD/lysophospholipase-like protein [Rhizodiscina lignyota]